MDTSDSMKTMISALALHLGDEEATLSVLQSMIAAEITGRRIDMNLTQKDLAHLLNVSQSTLSKWESGETNFTLSTLVSIATKLDIELQSPFVSTPPKVYFSPFSNVIAINPKSWTTSYSTAISQGTETETTSLVKEM